MLVHRQISLSPSQISSSTSKDDKPISNLVHSENMRKHLERINNDAADNSIYWQSEGALPHWILINFTKRKRAITGIRLELGSGGDESYAPMSIIVQGGDVSTCLVDIGKYHFADDSASLTSTHHYIDFRISNNDKALHLLFLKIIIVANCANGKDSRITSLRIEEEVEENDSCR